MHTFIIIQELHEVYRASQREHLITDRYTKGITTKYLYYKKLMLAVLIHYYLLLTESY